MDFHSLTRRELQSLCKQNKIPANITNVAMADALKSLEIVEGIEEFLNVSKSETADLVESMELLEVSSPKAPNTRCRTSARQKAKNTESENFPPTATRTTRCGTKQLAKGVEESKNDTLKTPAIRSTRRKALATSCRKLNSQLNESEEEGFVDKKMDCIPNTPAEVVMNSQRKATTVKEGTTQKTYSTRRSTRLTSKKSSEPRVEKEIGNGVQINSLLDEVNVAVISEDVSSMLVEEQQEKTVGSDTPTAEVEDICNAFEKIAVVSKEELNIEATQKSGEEKEVYGEVDNLKVESDETSNPCDDGDLDEKPKVEEIPGVVEVKTDEVCDQEFSSDSISSPGEDEVLEEKLGLGEEKFVASEVDDQNQCENENLEEKVKIEEKLDLVEAKTYVESDKELNSDEDLGENLDLGVEKFEAPSEDEDLEEKLDIVEKVKSEAKTDEVFDHSFLNPCEYKDIDLGEEKFDANEVSDQNPCDDEDVEEKLNLAERVSTNVKTDLVVDNEPKSESILSPIEDEDLGEKFDASEVNDQNLDKVSGEQSDNVELNSSERAESDGLTSPFEYDDSEGEHKSSEVNDQNLSDTVVDDDANSMVPDEVFDSKPISDSISNSSEDEEEVDEKLDASEFKVLASEENTVPMVNPRLESVHENLSTITEKADADSDENKFSVFPARLTPMKRAVTPFKNMTIVSDGKENIESGRKQQIGFVDEGKKIKNENNEKEKHKDLYKHSLRQLKKQLKALNINAKEDAANKEVTARPPLQVLNENRLVGEETKN